ncbi:MAG TPA: sigma-70 family RNA polymerase sigma factor [Bryobacteraceae bacterium]|nr:sigma-70 family RNA polymerase sigma factor [Bryobacteraceae bacterium]
MDNNTLRRAMARAMHFILPAALLTRSAREENMDACTGAEATTYFQFNAAYVDDLRNGSAATAEHFFRYFSHVLGRALETRTAGDLEDVRQETFLRVLRALRTPGAIQKPERFGAYVVSTARYVLLEHQRQHRWAPQDYESCPDTSPDPEVTAHAAEMQAHLRRALARLSDRDQRLVSMALLEEKTSDEISIELNVNKHSVPVMLHRARCRLREHMHACAPRNIG